MKNNCPLFRIGLSEAVLMKNYFKFFNIPMPTSSIYKTFSGTFSKSDGGLVQHGFANVTLRWDNLASNQAHFIKVFVDGSLGAVAGGTGYLYLTIPKNNADDIARTWIDVKGVPHPVDAEEGGSLPASRGIFYENMTLFVNAIEVLNDPASF